jgi:hypothetical protein
VIDPILTINHSCCRIPVLEGAEVKWSGVSVADRGEPEASCWNGTEMPRPVRTTAPRALECYAGLGECLEPEAPLKCWFTRRCLAVSLPRCTAR